MFVTMGDLGQAAEKSRQTSWWAWFFGLGPKPAKAYREDAFRQQQAGSTFDVNKAWGDMEFDAARSEDLDVFAEQGYDAAQALAGLPPRLADVTQWQVGMADDPKPQVTAAQSPPTPTVDAAPSPLGRASTVLVGSLALGALGAAAYGYMASKSEPETKTRRNRRTVRN